ncbi:MAG: glycosyltransferase family 4 protein [bacterium]
MKVRRVAYAALRRNYHAIDEPASLRALGADARARIPADADVVLAVTSLIAAALGPLDRPLVSWDDATESAMLDYYPLFRNLSARTRRQSESVGQSASAAVTLAIYSSEWAAASARDGYGLAPERTAVVPFGPNLDHVPDTALIHASIAARGQDCCRLLWVGVDWRRKGGPLAVAIAQTLSDAGVVVELTVAGCSPPADVRLPAWVRVEGFISKRSAEGNAHLASLFARAHFFVMPSAAEAYGLVLVEAAAFGVPVVAIRTGGVPTIVLDDETGLLEPATSGPAPYAERMLDLWRDRSRYDAMARAARKRVDETLNWEVAGRDVLTRLKALLPRRAT